MVAGTFNAFTTVDGQVQLSEAARPNGAAGTISLLFILFAMVFGVLQKKFNLSGWKATVVGLVCTIAALAIGMALPITAGKIPGLTSPLFISSSQQFFRSGCSNSPVI